MTRAEFIDALRKRDGLNWWVKPCFGQSNRACVLDNGILIGVANMDPVPEGLAGVCVVSELRALPPTSIHLAVYVSTDLPRFLERLARMKELSTHDRRYSAENNNVRVYLAGDGQMALGNRDYLDQVDLESPHVQPLIRYDALVYHVSYDRLRSPSLNDIHWSLVELVGSSKLERIGDLVGSSPVVAEPPVVVALASEDVVISAPAADGAESEDIEDALEVAYLKLLARGADGGITKGDVMAELTRVGEGSLNIYLEMVERLRKQGALLNPTSGVGQTPAASNSAGSKPDPSLGRLESISDILGGEANGILTSNHVCDIALNEPSDSEFDFGDESLGVLAIWDDKKRSYEDYCEAVGVVRLPHCRHLRLELTDFSDAVLANLTGLSQLTSLALEGGYNGCQITGVGLAHLAGFTRLTELDLLGLRITDADLAYLAALPQLTSLMLHDCCQITNAGLAHLAGLTQLTSLCLDCWQITSACLSHLAGLTQLTSLQLWSLQITDVSLVHLPRLTQLTSLDLSYCKFTGVFRQDTPRPGGQELAPELDVRAIHSKYEREYRAKGGEIVRRLVEQILVLPQAQQAAKFEVLDSKIEYVYASSRAVTSALYIAKLKPLTSLALSECDQFTDAALAHLGGLTQLTSLDLNSCYRITDAGLAHLAGLTQLTVLDLSWCDQITDAGLAHLAGLTQLTALDLSHCAQITDDGLTSISKMLPMCKVRGR